jgi:hypothetical protein
MPSPKCAVVLVIPIATLENCSTGHAAGALLMFEASGKLPGHLSNLWNLLSAWTATLLFCCQPIAQLARNLAAPETVSSLSLATVLLATTGNSMMVPRALFTKDIVWSVGSIWGSCMMGLGNLFCLAMAQTQPSQCASSNEADCNCHTELTIA